MILKKQISNEKILSLNKKNINLNQKAKEFQQKLQKYKFEIDSLKQKLNLISQNQNNSTLKEKVKFLALENRDLKKGITHFQRKNKLQSEEIKNLLSEIKHLRNKFQK